LSNITTVTISSGTSEDIHDSLQFRQALQDPAKTHPNTLAIPGQNSLIYSHQIRSIIYWDYNIQQVWLSNYF